MNFLHIFFVLIRNKVTVKIQVINFFFVLLFFSCCFVLFSAASSRRYRGKCVVRKLVWRQFISRVIRSLIITMEITSSFYAVFLFSIFCYSNSEICGSCFCEEEIATCYLISCSSVIVKSPEIEVIKIYGDLCSNHVEDLADIFYHNTIIELTDGHCPHQVSNCR